MSSKVQLSGNEILNKKVLSILLLLTISKFTDNIYWENNLQKKHAAQITRYRYL